MLLVEGPTQSSSFTNKKMKPFLQRVSKHLPLKQIIHQSENKEKILVLERFNILSMENGPGLVLHRFVHSDPDRGYHDHPWTFGVSLILSGGYREIKVKHGTMEMSERVFKTGNINFFSGNDYHRVLLFQKDDQLSRDKETTCVPEEEDVWTLFFYWKREKVWGFLKESDKCDQKWEYNQYSKTIEDTDGAWWKKGSTT